MHKQSETMLNKGITPVIEAINKLPEQKRTVAKRKGLIKYYQKNESRMQYHEFLEKELLIGSGAIESAKGFQQMAELRVVYKSKQEKRIRQLCQKEHERKVVSILLMPTKIRWNVTKTIPPGTKGQLNLGFD